MTRLRALAVLFGLSVMGAPMVTAASTAACAATPEPVVSLSYGSRYQTGDKSRSAIDKVSNAEVNKALAPVEKFIRSLARDSNKILKGDSSAPHPDCIIQSLATWAKADALSDLQSFTANLSVGSRMVGFGMVYMQMRDRSDLRSEKKQIEAWLQRRAREQILFWEEDATQGAKRGNLRAWATLGINLAGMLAEDEVSLRWSAYSASYLQCQALEDGSLPQEMRRGKYALHYQLHAIAPMVVSTVLLEQQGLSILGACDHALKRIVQFALSDLEDGAKSEAYSGKPQSYFDGTEKLRNFEMAWLEAYLMLYNDPVAEGFASKFSPLAHSKLGGDQTLVWRHFGL